MTAAATWYDAERVAQPGSVILNRWRAERQAARGQGVGVRNEVTSSMSMAEFADWVRGNTEQRSGVVTERSAMQISTVYACVNLIGGAIASMPLQFYRRDGANEREAYKPDEWWMLNESPCPAWSAATAWEYGAQSLLLRGDMFWQIQRASRLSSKIVGFAPKHPATVRVRAVQVPGAGDRLAYDIDPQLGDPIGAKRITLDQDDVLHVPGPNFDGLRGMPQLTSVLRLAGGIALSADEYMLSFFRNSARPDYAMETDAALNKDQIKNIKDQLEDAHRGVDRAWKPIILQGGLKIKPITITPEEAQMMEIRRLQVEDICRAMGVPPFMVGHTDKTTSWGSGVEQMGIGFVKYTLQRHLVKIEQEVNRKIFRTSRNFCEFVTAGLERGDLKTRFDAYRVALGRAGEAPWMAVDEIRRLENLPPRADLTPPAAAASDGVPPNSNDPGQGAQP